MPARLEIDSSQLRLVARKIRDLDPQIRKEMTSGLKRDLKPYAENIANDVPVLGSPGRCVGLVMAEELVGVGCRVRLM
jgi:hypothetical protein